MSGEFSWTNGGYMHSSLATHAEDCRYRHNAEITKRFGLILAALQPVARGICWHEAHDSSVDYPILQAVKQLPEIESAVRQLDEYLRPFAAVQEEAIREFVAAHPVTEDQEGTEG